MRVAGANTLAFEAGDVTRDLTLFSGATGTTSAAGNIASASVSGGSRLTLGGPITGTGNGQVVVSGAGTVLDVQGFAIDAFIVRLDAATTLANEGGISTTSWNQTAFTNTLRNGNDTFNRLSLDDAAVLRVASG